MAETANYRRLGRNGSGLLFQRALLALCLLVLFLYLFYKYMTISSELAAVREELEMGNADNVRLKGELVEAKVKLEQVQNNEQECRGKGAQTERKLEACETEKDAKAELVAKMETDKAECRRKMEELLDQERKNTEQTKNEQQKHTEQIANLEKTIQSLHIELDNGTRIPEATTVPETRTTTAGSMPVILGAQTAKHRKSKDTAHEQEEENGSAERQQRQEEALRAQQQGVVDFAGPHRSPGGRVHVEEAAEQREKLASNRELLSMAAKLEEQRKKEKMEDHDQQQQNNSAQGGKQQPDPGVEDGVGGIEVPALKDVEKDDQRLDNPGNLQK